MTTPSEYVRTRRCAGACYNRVPVDSKSPYCGRCLGRRAVLQKQREEHGAPEPGPVPPVFQPREEREAGFPDMLRHARIHWHTVGRNPNPGCNVCALWTEIVRLRRLCAALGAEPAEIDREYPATIYGPETDPWELPLANEGAGPLPTVE